MAEAYFGIVISAMATGIDTIASFIFECQENHQVKFPTYSFVIGLVSMLYLTVQFG